jgi:hypothetical protein
LNSLSGDETEELMEGLCDDVLDGAETDAVRDSKRPPLERRSFPCELAWEAAA